MYVLGIDGGGTKTKGVIANAKGDVIAAATVGASNPNSIKAGGIKEELRKLISILKKQSNDTFFEVKKVFAGMSGVDNDLSKKNMHHLIASIKDIPGDVSVDNDGITALYSGTLGDAGVVQIAGTGSITYGLNENGDRGRVGGWGHLIGEKGSGFALGRDGLDAAFMAHDGLQEPTEIKRLLLDHFQEKSLRNIIQPIYQRENVKELIASLSTLVIKAFENGDSIAEDIIRKNGLQMGESIVCLFEKIFAGDERFSTIPVVITGGLFSRLDLFQPYIESVIAKSDFDARFIVPKIDPVGGAVVAAFQEENIQVEACFAKNFSKTN